MSETVAMTLTEWLAAQIAEDEAVARAATPGPWEGGYDDSMSPYWSVWTAKTGDQVANHDLVSGSYEEPHGNEGADAHHIARHDPARVLAECASKRRIVDDLSRFISTADTMGARKDHPTLLAGLERQLLYLAQPYADRPGWRSEWAL